MNYIDKEICFKRGWYVCAVPPVPTANWPEDSWIGHIDANGKWFEVTRHYDEAIELIVDNHHGVYVPQIFAQYVRDGVVKLKEPIPAEDNATLLDGPDNEWYWDAWTSVVDSAELAHFKDGSHWGLSQDDGDVWATHPDAAWDEAEQRWFLLKRTSDES